MSSITLHMEVRRDISAKALCRNHRVRYFTVKLKTMKRACKLFTFKSMIMFLYEFHTPLNEKNIERDGYQKHVPMLNTIPRDEDNGRQNRLFFQFHYAKTASFRSDVSRQPSFAEPLLILKRRPLIVSHLWFYISPSL